MALIFVTGNRHKFEEVSEIAANQGLKLEMRELACREVQADELEEIARQSAIDACASLGKPCFVEDAGLFVQALRGFPGPYSSYVFRTIGNKGLLRLMVGVSNRQAEFRSVVAYCKPRGKPRVFTGKVKGSISLETRGTQGFGYDPIFLAKHIGKTFGEMKISRKNKISHRGRSFEKFIKWYLRTH